MGGGRLISVYAPNATTPSRIMHANATIVTLTAAADGTLYVDTGRAGVSVYAPGKNHSKRSFDPPAQVSGLALGRTSGFRERLAASTADYSVTA